jgi:L-rhamnose isomerase/sugar isomerase
MAYRTLKAAYETDVTPLVAMARIDAGGALDPIATYRAAGYRQQRALARPQSTVGKAGIV